MTGKVHFPEEAVRFVVTKFVRFAGVLLRLLPERGASSRSDTRLGGALRPVPFFEENDE